MGFTFAIENIDPSIGTVYAYHADWLPYGGDTNKVITPIELVDCKELEIGGAYEDQRNENLNYGDIMMGRYDTNYLCPVNLESLKL